MRARYDFSRSVRNPYRRKPKRQVTIRLDAETIEYFKRLASQSGISYQSLINLYLRDCAAGQRRLKIDWAS
jgi:uncharacterized protein (DUF4415 family)